jgi:tRNA(Ile)-lysidine synthase
LRGAGIQGLRGIAAKREAAPGISLIRPLLNVTREEIVAYLNSLNQPWREDASNSDLAFTRNRIRHELMPILRTYNPAIVEGFGRLAEQAGEIHDEQAAAAMELLHRAELPSAGALRIFRVSELRNTSRDRIRGMFRLLWEREIWSASDMTFDHWKRLVAVALGEETANDLPGGISVRFKGNVVQVGKTKEE